MFTKNCTVCIQVKNVIWSNKNNKQTAENNHRSYGKAHKMTVNNNNKWINTTNKYTDTITTSIITLNICKNSLIRLGQMPKGLQKNHYTDRIYGYNATSKPRKKNNFSRCLNTVGQCLLIFRWSENFIHAVSEKWIKAITFLFLCTELH